jgi:large subunit ribosomal protein L24
MKIHKGDEVVVIAGKDIGKRGEVTRVFPERDKVIVTSSQLINVAKKHQKQTRATMQGGIIDKEMPIHISNVALVCSSCGPTRIGYRFDSDGAKVRVCKKCGADI